MGKFRTRTYGAAYINIETHKGRTQAFSYLIKSRKINRFSVQSLLLLDKANKAYRIWKKTKSKTARKRFERTFNKLYGYNPKKGTQTNLEVGVIKNIGGTKSLSFETVRYRRIKSNYSDYNMIRDFESFMSIYGANTNILADMGVMSNFDAFVNDTDTGWTRRTMEKMGISSEVSSSEFYEWLETRRM